MAQNLTLVLVEKNVEKNKRQLFYTQEKNLQIGELSKEFHYKSTLEVVQNFLTKAFLPAGYPQSVTPDYLQYQVLNALQAFCSSLTTLIASRAVLEGMGVGDPSASSTHAMLLSVLQDAFGRIATIVGAYYVGTSLVPEAKAYRFLADVLNDLAVIIDVFSPVLNAYLLPGARVVGLCMAAASRALCGVVAGGSKAAITLHFATPAAGLGDVGDLNAKDTSKETVLALAGMLLGALIVPRITSAPATYIMLFILVIAHLAINYAAVQGLALRHLNKQRASLVWLRFRSEGEKVLSPQEASKQELILHIPGIIHDPETYRVIGECHIGSAPLDVLRGSALSIEFLDIFSAERYIVCFDANKPVTQQALDEPGFYPVIHVCFREGFTQNDQLKGWFHAAEICLAIKLKKTPDFSDPELGKAKLIETTYGAVNENYEVFRDNLKKVGWNVMEHYLMSGHGPKAVLHSVAETSDTKVQI